MPPNLMRASLVHIRVQSLLIGWFGKIQTCLGPPMRLWPTLASTFGRPNWANPFWANPFWCCDVLCVVGCCWLFVGCSWLFVVVRGGPPRFHTSTQELQTCTFQGPGLEKHQNSTKRPPKREREREKSENGEWEREINAKFWARSGSGARGPAVEGPAHGGSSGRNEKKKKKHEKVKNENKNKNEKMVEKLKK